MKKAGHKIKVRWEHIPAPDAAARLTAAFALLFEHSTLSQLGDDQNLTENSAGSIMPHEDS